MSETLHILPSTNDFEALAQIRILARHSSTKHTCVCLQDPATNHAQLQQWMGANVRIQTPASRSLWMQASQLYRIGKTLRVSHPSNLCWNPGRFSISALPLLTQLASWNSIITTPSCCNDSHRWPIRSAHHSLASRDDAMATVPRTATCAIRSPALFGSFSTPARRCN